MLAAIGFDNKTVLKGYKINHPNSNRHLPSEFHSGQTTISQQAPQRPLRIR